MKILIVGGTGLIGKAVSSELKKLNHEVITASKNNADIKVDLANHSSIEKMYQECPNLDALIACAGSGGKKSDLANLTIEDYKKSLELKGFGQMDLVLTGLKYLNSGGSFTLTTGILSEGKLPQTSCITMVNNAVEGFVKSAAFELPNNLRLNAISPNVITEALDRFGSLFTGYEGVSLKSASLAYVRSVLGKFNGEILKVW
ncbi:MAG: hypothetical protein S4CHLAM6_10570 [Chlamydiae bacterium]|nr:hypothetical protein [Chlamydiota bacterium]